MLTPEQNDLITRTDRGTPGGDLMRRYWQPVAVARHLGDAPQAVRMLGEDLVLFRDGGGKPALIGQFCPHRGVDLSYGRVEDGGLRCVYHGWLIGTDGRCLEQPGEPANSTFRERVRQTAYPCCEAGGLIWAYLGPQPAPRMPSLPFVNAAPEQSWATRLYLECNYLQGNEGNVDPQHLSFLHRMAKPSHKAEVYKLTSKDVAPRIETEPTDFGTRVYAIRSIGEGEHYVRVTNFIMPNGSAFIGSRPVDPKVQDLPLSSYYKLHWHVPIDDTHHWKYEITYRLDGPCDPSYLETLYEAVDPWQPKHRRNFRNRYLQDRDEQRTATYTGIGRHFNDHDRMATETQGPVFDRSREHLGVTDKAIIAMRRQLFAGIEAIEAGGEPLGVERDDTRAFDELIVREDRLAAGVDPVNYWRAVPA